MKNFSFILKLYHTGSPLGSVELFCTVAKKIRIVSTQYDSESTGKYVTALATHKDWLLQQATYYYNNKIKNNASN